MCGSNSQQDETYDAQKQMMDTLNQGYTAAYANNQEILGALTKAFTPILNAGPMQEGMAPGDVTAQRTAATENVAQSYSQAQKATADILASQGGGNTFLPSGTNDTLLAKNADAAARTQASAFNDITAANYKMGYQNWQNASSTLSGLASQYNPLGYASGQISAGNSAASSAAAIAAAANSPWNAAIGALGAVGGAALGNPSGIASMFSKGVSSLASGASSVVPGFPGISSSTPAYAGGF
jgi:hypothetical protein